MTRQAYIVSGTLVSLLMVAALIALLTDPIAQDPRYHDFADQRRMVGVPNFHNVMSNLPFLAIGLMGLRLVAFEHRATTPQTKIAWLIFFFGIFLTAFGSGYFHYDPNNETLFWDRLPMTIGFMSLVSIIVSEYFSPWHGSRLLLPLLLAGALSVVYWTYTESFGRGDLRPYALVQFVPMLLIPIIILRYSDQSDLGPYLWWTIGFYFAAKLAEHFDDQIYAVGGLLSGHALKHLLASLAPACLLIGLHKRVSNGE